MKHKLQLASILLTALIAGGTAFADNASEGTNRADNRVLMGSSHNVFVGKIADERGTEPATGLSKYSSYQYGVNVILNIKGNLQGTVTIRQDETRYLPLEIGSTYVFAARYFSGTDYYFVPSRVYDYQLLTSDSRLSNNQLKTLAESNDRVKILHGNYSVEQIPGYDVHDGSTYNSYATRCLDANGELIDDTVQIQREKQGLPKAECVTPLKAGEPSPGWITETKEPKAGEKFLLIFAALAILAAAVATAFVMRLALKSQKPKA